MFVCVYCPIHEAPLLHDGERRFLRPSAHGNGTGGDPNIPSIKPFPPKANC